MKESAIATLLLILILQFGQTAAAPSARQETEELTPTALEQSQGEYIPLLWIAPQIEPFLCDAGHSDITAPEPDEPEPDEVDESDGYVSLGVFRVSHFCPGKCCNGKWAGQTSTGNPLVPYRTVAVDSRVIPYDTVVIIDGQEYIAHDTGGAIKGDRIDVCVPTHKIAMDSGVYYAEVFVKG